MTAGVERWMERVAGPEWTWYVKVLSGNDTLLNESHQAGPYIPKVVIASLFPALMEGRELNPRRDFDIVIDSHGTNTAGTAIWYNNRVVADGTRNECRITNWGGRQSPVLDPEATGSLCVFAFHRGAGNTADGCRVWLCRSVEEEDAVLDRVGPVEPGTGVLYGPAGLALASPAEEERDRPCHLGREDMAPEWLVTFPQAEAIIGRAVEHLPRARRLPPDGRLLRRRDCEYQIFRSVEEVHVLPRVREGFATVDLFVAFANAVTNRRKSRSGASLELQAKRIFDEEELRYSHDEESERRKRPDFLFPSAERYRDATWPVKRLRMLAAKTTCKDRWRQILDEAERIPTKHLLTLQEGVSLGQFGQMQAGGVVLVVPSQLHNTYHESVRPHLLTVESFIAETKATCGG